MFLTILLQQNLALVVGFYPSSFRTGAGLRPKKCGRGRRELGLSVGRVRVISVWVQGGSRQNFSNSCRCGVGRV